jgi:hypothetical protein
MNKKMLLIGGAAVAVWYFFLRKPQPTTNLSLPSGSPKVPITTNTVVVAPQASKTYVYPAGLNENDYVKFGTDETVYLLHNAQRLPISYDWWMANAKDSWDTIKYVSASVALDIPKGNTL